MINEYQDLLKKYQDVKKLLNKNIPDLEIKDQHGRIVKQDFTYDQAIRAYLWIKNQQKLKIKVTDDFKKNGLGISSEQSNLIEKFVTSDKRLLGFAQNLERIIDEPNGYIRPTPTWLMDKISSDINSAITKSARKRYLSEFIKNRKRIFNNENLKKIEAIYGKVFRESLEDITHRMETGINRVGGKDRQANAFENFIMGSSANIMFLNSRSAALQLISFVNFVNWSDNNIFKAGAAFANQPQFWSDVGKLFDSPKLKQRRRGLKTDISTADLASYVEGRPDTYKAFFEFLKKLGFAPTQIADSAAISVGGATFYRNRINTYLKQGKTKEQAEKQAFEDFSIIAEETQQSTDPSLISKEQSSRFGRYILAFANVPLQYNRLIKKSVLDLANRRGDPKTHISKIIYYGLVQNAFFNGIQNGLFFLFFDDEIEEEERKIVEKYKQGDLFSKDKKVRYSKPAIEGKIFRTTNGVLNTLLRGSGIKGAALAAMKDAIFEYYKQDEKKFSKEFGKVIADLANVSPLVGDKVNQLYRIMELNEYEKDVIKDVPLVKDKFPYFQLDHPTYQIYARAIQFANFPANRLRTKAVNLEAKSKETKRKTKIKKQQDISRSLRQRLID